MKKLIHSIVLFISNLFGKLPPLLKKSVDIGIKVTDAIKNFDHAEPMVADILTTLIPGDIDDKIKVLLRANLPKIAVELRLVDATLGLTDPNQIMVAASKALQQINSDYSVREGFLNSLAIVIAQVASDGKLDWNDAAYVIKYYFDHKNDA